MSITRIELAVYGLLSKEHSVEMIIAAGQILLALLMIKFGASVSFAISTSSALWLLWVLPYLYSLVNSVDTIRNYDLSNWHLWYVIGPVHEAVGSSIKKLHTQYMWRKGIYHLGSWVFLYRQYDPTQPPPQ